MYKKILSTLLLAGCSINVMAQATLTAANFNPQIGDAFVNHICDTTGVNQGASGANITWNFSTLSITSTDTGGAVACSATAACSDYSGSSYAITSDATDLVTYYSASAGNQSLKGYYASADSNVIYSTPVQQFVYPFTYGTNFSAPYAGVITYGPFSFHEAGNVTVDCDGYGTLMLPFGVSEDSVLRVHSSQTFKDSASIFGIDTVATFTIQTYSWYKANYHSPLLAIATITQVGGTYSNKAVSYAPVQSGVAAAPLIQSISSTLHTYPNPVVNELNISFYCAASQYERISLLDVTGRETAVIADKYMTGSQNITYGTASLPKGIYLLRLQSATETVTRKVEIL